MFYSKKLAILTLILISILPIKVNAQDVRISSGGDALAVFDLKIDQTAVNAVKAKEKAINEAKLQALDSLARRILRDEEYKDFKAPNISTINTLVRDFEIRDEKLSSNRYIAKFTVRFNDNAVDFIRGKRGFFNRFDSKRDNLKNLNERDKTVLILPYYKNFYGENQLWEEPNPWRDAWQGLGGVRISSKISIIVPMGDIEDISFGSSQEIWEAMPEAITELKEKYKADEIIIPRAYRKGKNLEIDIYSHNIDEFKLEKSITSYLAGKSFQPAIDDIIYDKDFFAEITDGQSKEEDVQQTQVNLKVSMFFKNFKEWMEAQKRINSIEPKVKFKINSLNSSEVNFEITLPSEVAHIELKNNFRTYGLVLTTPDYNYDGGYFSGNMDKVTYNYMLILRD